jgi:hypothetical protein
MRNRILSKAVPALEFCPFYDSQNCVLLVREFWGFDSNRILQLFVSEIILAAVLNLHILQGCAKQCRAFFGRGSQKTVCGGAEEVNPAAAS